MRYRPLSLKYERVADYLRLVGWRSFDPLLLGPAKKQAFPGTVTPAQTSGRRIRLQLSYFMKLRLGFSVRLLVIFQRSCSSALSG